MTSIQAGRPYTETEEANIALVRRLIDEGFSKGDEGVFDDVMAEDCVEHQRGNGGGREGAKATMRTLHSWMSDFTLTIDDITADGDVVWLRNTGTGVNTGSILGNPPTGKSVSVTVYDQVRIRDGKIVEHWGVPDQLGMMLQLGIFPPKPPTAG